MDELWEKTYDIYGYSPLFKMPCRYCDRELQLRFSIIYKDYSMIQKYKCPSCGWFAMFELDVDNDYQKKVFERRGKEHTITPTVSELSEDEEIARQLEGLGYFGGRDGK